jgi:hypothetical protein
MNLLYLVARSSFWKGLKFGKPPAQTGVGQKAGQIRFSVLARRRQIAGAIDGTPGFDARLDDAAGIPFWP